MNIFLRSRHIDSLSLALMAVAFKPSMVCILSMDHEKGVIVVCAAPEEALISNPDVNFLPSAFIDRVAKVEDNEFPFVPKDCSYSVKPQRGNFPKNIPRAKTCRGIHRGW